MLGAIVSRTDSPESLIRSTISLWGKFMISIPFTAITLSPIINCPHRAAADPSIIFPKIKNFKVITIY